MGKKKNDKKDEKKNGKKSKQQEGESHKIANVNGISVEKQNIIPNIGKSIEQNIKPRRGMPNDNDKDNKKERTKLKRSFIKKEQRKVGFGSNWFSIKRLFFFYILAVFFWCSGKTQEQCNSYEEALCFNGVSQYILNHDYFRYIEPAIDMVKQNVDAYGKKALDTASVHYETHVKPYVEPLFDQPYLQDIRELSAKGLTKAREFYNDNAREHVDNYYNQSVKFLTPYVNQAQEHATYTYEQALEYNNNTIKPLYYKKVIPFVTDFKDKVILYYDTKMVPSAYYSLEVIKETYYEKIVPVYHNRIEPHILTLLEFIQEKKIRRTKTERKTKEADKKDKVEVEKKAEADKKDKVEADMKAKVEADKKAKVEAEKKAKADKKAKVEAEKKAKADKKAIEVISKSVRDAFRKELPLVKKNITFALDDYERKATSVTQNILYEIEARISALKNSGSGYLAELKKFTEKVKSNKKNRKTKLNEIMDLAKKLIESIKEQSQEFVEISKKSFNDLEEKTFNELKKEFDLNLVSQASKIYNLMGNNEIDDRLRTDIEMTVNDIIQEFNGDKNNASLRVRKIFAIIKSKIDLLTSTKDSIVKDIYSHVKIEKEILKTGNGDNKNSDMPSIEVSNVHKDDNQIPVQVKETPSTKEEASDNLLITIKDPILEKLKVRQDLVLDKLKIGYSSFKAEKGNEPLAQVQSIDEEEYYEDDEETESDE